MNRDLFRKFQSLRLACGWVHTILVSDEGQFYGFGLGKNGELGHGTFSEYQAAPINFNLPPIKRPETVVVAAGSAHTIILADGNVYSTGSQDDGRLGHHLVHGQIKFPNVDRISYVACGADASLAVSEDGNTIYAWGRGYTTAANPEPQGFTLYDPIANLRASAKITMVSCGTEHSLALCADGTVWSWGKGKNGRLGHGTEADSKTPQLVKSLVLSEEQKIVHIASGDSHNLALSAEGRVFAWGSGAYGRLGLGTEMDVHTPTIVDGDLQEVRVLSVSCNSFHSLALVLPDNDDYSLYTWGGGKYGKLGHGDTANRLAPTPVELFKKPQRAIRAVCGQHHTVAVSLDNRVFAWGCTTSMRIGVHTDSSAAAVPVRVDFFDDKRLCAMAAEIKDLEFKQDDYKARMVAAGERHTLALAIESQRNVIFAWGSNSQGQMGVGKMPMSARPVPVPLPAPSSVIITSIVCGSNFSMCLSDHGTIFSWGGNERGQLGLGDTVSRFKPEVIKALQGTHITTIVAGWSHVAAIATVDDSDAGPGHDDVYVWGDHQYGQLGVGSEEDEGVYPCYPPFFAFPKSLRLPKEIPTDRKRVQRERVSITLGTTHSVFLVERYEISGRKVIEARVYTCGMGKYGQLGRHASVQSTYATPLLVKDWDLHMDDIKFARDSKELSVKSRRLPKVHLVAASDKATIAVSNPGDIEVVYAWGMLPGLTKDPNPLPTYIEKLNNGEDLRRELASDLPINDFKVLKIVMARSHCFLLCRYNEKANHGRAPVVFGWGETQYGKLGVGNVAKHMAEKALEQQQKANSGGKGLEDEEQEQEILTVVQPEVLKSFRSLRIRQITAMADHNALCTDEGEAYVWGYGDSGRLGLGTTDGRSSGNKSEAEPKVIPIFHKAERQMARVLRRRMKQQQEEKQQQGDIDGTEAADIAYKSRMLRNDLTRSFKIHKHDHEKAALEQIELTHAAIVRRADQSQRAVDSITSQHRIRETNEERRQLKMREGSRRREEHGARDEEHEPVKYHADGHKMNVPPDKPDSGGLVCCCFPGGDDWDLEVDVESRGEADDDMEGFFEEKLLNQKVSFERDLLNTAELIVTRLYMQPCQMFRAFQLYASSVQNVLYSQDSAPRQRKKKGAAAAAAADAAGTAGGELGAADVDKTKSVKTVEKANCLRNRFSNLVFSVYDLHREEDIRVFHVFLRLVLEFTTRGKTKQSILTEDSIEWTLFRDIFLHGRIRRQLSDLLARALSELTPFPPPNDRSVACVTPVDWLDKYLQDKTPDSVVQAFRLVRHKTDQLLGIIESEQFFSQMMNIMQWPLVVLSAALRRNKIDPAEVLGRVTMRVLAEVMLADQTYQFEVKRRQLQRRGFGLQEGDDDNIEVDPLEDPNNIKLRGGKGWSASSAMDAVVCSGASQIGPSETLVLLQLRDVGAEITHDDVTDLMLYVTGRYKIPDYVMKQTEVGSRGLMASEGMVTTTKSIGIIQSMNHALLDHVSNHVVETEIHESKGESSTFKQMQLDLLTHFLKMPFFFSRRITQVSRSSLPLLCRSRDFCSSKDMKKVMKELGYRSRLEEQNWHDWERVNLRIDPTRCDFDLRRKSNEDACEICRCMHPRPAAVGGGGSSGSGSGYSSASGATNAILAADGQRKDMSLTFNKLECDLMFDILVEDKFNVILEDLNGEAAWHAIMSELKGWRERRIDEYSEQEGGHDYEIAAYAFKRLIRVLKGTKIELGERHDLVSLVADGTSVEPALLKEKLTERDAKKRHHMDEEQRKVAALDQIKRFVDNEIVMRPQLTEQMSRNFEGITSATVVDSKFLENNFGLTIKNTDQRALKKFADRLHRWDSVHVVRERGKVVRFSYHELTSKGVLYRVKPLRKYLPCVTFCCLSTLACLRCVDEDERRLISFLNGVHFVLLTTADPDLVHLKLAYQTSVTTANLVILRSMLVSLKALASDDCQCHKIYYDPLGDDVPMHRSIVFQFSKSKLKRMLQKFPRNMKDDGIQAKDDDVDII